MCRQQKNNELKNNTLDIEKLNCPRCGKYNENNNIAGIGYCKKHQEEILKEVKKL